VIRKFLRERAEANFQAGIASPIFATGERNTDCLIFLLLHRSNCRAFLTEAAQPALRAYDGCLSRRLRFNALTGATVRLQAVEQKREMNAGVCKYLLAL
jgi:hypothetical protein